MKGIRLSLPVERNSTLAPKHRDHVTPVVKRVSADVAASLKKAASV
jgi:hypothetical protein